MAQNATIYKVELSVSDMDRHYYETHKLTLAKHPSETDEQLMLRILAFALNAHAHLEMTKGLSTGDEPDIWQKSLSRVIELWVALGLPNEMILRQSCNKAGKLIVYPYGSTAAEMGWNKIGNGQSPQLDLSRNCSVPLTWYFATKERHHGIDPNPGIPRRGSAGSVEQRATA
jgi:uncharacterized protein YaeQ